MLFFLIWITFGRLLLSSAFNTPICYTSVGTIAPNDQACHPDDPKHSVCCPAGAICSANKVCILPNGLAHRGSCTDRTWGRECPHFCLSEHTGNDGLTGVNMTLCHTNPTSTAYCCNDWTGRSCDCKNGNLPQVTLELFSPVAIIAAENTETAKSSEGIIDLYDIPWNTVGPILASIMSLMLLSMLLYLARSFYLSSRKKDPTRNHSFMEHGRRFSDFFRYNSIDEKARADSSFSIGTLDTDLEPKDRKASARSVRFSVSRSKSEGDKNPVTEPEIVWNEAFTRREFRPSVASEASAPPKTLTKTRRPTFKRQDTDFAAVSGAKEGVQEAATDAKAPFPGRQRSIR